MEISKYISREKAATVLADLVKTPSISRNEGQLAEKLKDMMVNMGFEAHIDSHGNMIAGKKYARQGVKLALNSHMDTVDVGDGWTEKPFGAEIRNNVLYGLGSCDCKGSIAGMLLAMNAITKSDLELKGELCFTAVVQEEVQGENNKGTVKLIKDGFKADMVLVGEPTKLTICRGCEGMVEVEVTTRGIAVHGSNAEDGVNAITNMVRIIDRVSKIKAGCSDLLGNGSINVGVISGGLRSSVVPDQCSLKIGRFVVEGETGPAFLDQVNGIIHDLKCSDPSFTASAALTYNSAAGVVSENTPIVGALKEATRDFMGAEAPVTGMRAHLDSDFLINLAGIPAIAFGPGDMAKAHKADEHVSIEEVVTAAKIYAGAIMRILSE